MTSTQPYRRLFALTTVFFLVSASQKPIYFFHHLCYHFSNQYKWHTRDHVLSQRFPERKRQRLQALHPPRSGYPSPACTETARYTSRPRYRSLERVFPACTLETRKPGGTTESVITFSSHRGMKRFFIVFMWRILACR
jgi:hypothetical protein